MMIDIDTLAKVTYKAVYRWQRPDFPEERWEETWAELPEEDDGMTGIVLPKTKNTFRILTHAVLEEAGVDDLLEILRFAKQELPRICVACFRGDCEDCPLREVVNKTKAVLDRAEEGASGGY